PEGWAWARLGQIVATCGGKTPSKANKEFWEGGGVPWITSKDMKAAELYGSQIELAPLGAAETGTVPAGSVLMVVRSGILRRLLPVAINRVETTINQDLKAMTPFHGGFSKWLLTCFSAWDKRIRNTYHKDGTTVDSIEFDSMLTMLLPVPPLAEQRRIVERIEELFNHLD
ncbi:restriction endonuclease subunit S, partial [Collinsella aerofaciens]